MTNHPPRIPAGPQNAAHEPDPTIHPPEIRAQRGERRSGSPSVIASAALTALAATHQGGQFSTGARGSTFDRP
jgi:hypothetical protein